MGKSFREDDLRRSGLKNFFESIFLGHSVHSVDSDIGSVSAHSQMCASSTDVFRVSMSSTVSSSSQGSAQHEADAMGVVYMWGEGICDGILGGGIHRVGQALGAEVDAFLPKALESTVALDVQQVACGARHAMLVTKQGELFCWGEESGGRLGHVIDADVAHPKLIETLATTNIGDIACGEYHSCAVSLSGELYTWGDGTHNVGLLGHGSDVSHWMPRRISGPLEGLRVASVSCGPWHTALVASSGQLFTFGDGTFGVLGHGDKNSTSLPRLVDSLKGFKTASVSCGVWHSAAVVEVMVGSTGSSICSSGKLFTWGDGARGHLGHGDTKQKLVPTCVAALVEHNFCQVACGHSLTVGLTISGQVFTMGNMIYRQLGDPDADGKVPMHIQGKLSEVLVKEVACGDFHTAVLTSKGEVFTWGKGANGRLGHGDSEDRNFPTLVEALKDKQVLAIACGSSFTAAICLHKWVSGADQSVCSGCQQPFGFTRKRHNCYNCGLVYCHSCSSKKALKASMAPNPSKPYRVCDPCHMKLKKAAETSLNFSGSAHKGAVDNKERPDKWDPKILRSQPAFSKPTAIEQLKLNEHRSYLKKFRKSDLRSSCVSPVRSGSSQHLTYGPSRRLVSASVPHSRIVSRATSPIASRRSSPPRSTMPIPTLMGFASPTKGEDISELRAQVEDLTRRCHLQDAELKHSAKQLHEAHEALNIVEEELAKCKAAKDVITSLTTERNSFTFWDTSTLPLCLLNIAEEESAKCKAAKDVIKSLTTQLKGITEKVHGEMCCHNRSATATNLHTDPSTVVQPPSATNGLGSHSRTNIHDSNKDSTSFPNGISNGTTAFYVNDGPVHGNGKEISIPPSNRQTNDDFETHLRNGSSSKSGNLLQREPGVEWFEQDEPGVYIRLVSLPSGRRDLKHVRFSRSRFSEKQAEQWWQENKARVHELYNVEVIERSATASSARDH